MRKVLDKSVSIDDGSGKGTLEADLLKAGRALQLPKDITLGYAIQILASADEDREHAESVHTSRVLGMVEQHRHRIFLVANGKVLPPPKVKVERETIPRPVPLNGAVHADDAASVLASASSAISPSDARISSPASAAPEPLTATHEPLPENFGEWTPAQILQFLDAVENRTDKAHGSLRKMLETFKVSEAKYFYWKKQREKIVAKAAQSAPLALDPASVSSDGATSPASVPAPELPADYKTWQPAQIIALLDHCQNRSGEHGSLAKILRHYGVSPNKYHYWVKTRATLEMKAKSLAPAPPSVESGLPAASEPVENRISDIANPAPAASETAPIVKRQLTAAEQYENDLGELGYFPDVLDQLAESLDDPFVTKLADLIRFRHAELTARFQSTSAEGNVPDAAELIEVVSLGEQAEAIAEIVEKTLPVEKTADEFSHELEELDPASPVAVSENTPAQILWGHAVSDAVIDESSAPSPVAASEVQSATVSVPIHPLPKSVPQVLDDTRPKLFALVSAAPKPVERTEDDRREVYIKAASLRINGSVKAWTYAEALENVCDHYAGILTKIFEYDPEFAKSRDVPFPERKKLGSGALRTVADQYDPMRDGDLIQFLEKGVRAELRKNPRLCTQKDPQAAGSAAAPAPTADGVARAREGMALLWASSHLREDVLEYRDLVGVLIKKHMAWVFPLAESLHDPDGEVPVKTLQNAGYQELKRAILEFDFTDDITYDSFKDAVEGRVQTAIVDCANGAPEAWKGERPAARQPSSKRLPSGSTKRPSMSPGSKAAGLVKQYRDMSRPLTPLPVDESAFCEFARTLGIEGADHHERAVQVIERYLHLADEIASVVLDGSHDQGLLQSLSDAGRFAIVKFSWKYLPSSGDFESNLRAFVESQIRFKLSQKTP